MQCRWFIFQQRCDTDFFWKSLTSPTDVQVSNGLSKVSVGDDQSWIPKFSHSFMKWKWANHKHYLKSIKDIILVWVDSWILWLTLDLLGHLVLVNMLKNWHHILGMFGVSRKKGTKRMLPARSLKSVLVLSPRILGPFGPPKKRVNFVMSIFLSEADLHPVEAIFSSNIQLCGI